ncbi:MAG: MBL fold metallo-hydrolase [Vicinamibacteria bacterium]
MFRVPVLLALLALASCAGEDPRVRLSRAAERIGATTLVSMRYEATGHLHVFGQSARPGNPGPRFALDEYVVEIDFTAPAMAETFTRRPIGPPRGGAGQPLEGPERHRWAVARDVAWDETPDGVVARARPVVEERFVEIWLTPHGFVKAALAHDAAVTPRDDGGLVVRFTALDRYTVTGEIGPDDFVERVESAVVDPLAGDVPVLAVYHGYRQFGGLWFPTVISRSKGGQPVHDLEVRGVIAGAPVALAPPADLPDGDARPPVAIDEVDEGVHYVTGGTHHSVVIEFNDHLAIVEAPLDEAWSEAVIAAVREAIPGKTIRYVINTHHHADHAGGLRTYVAEGAVVVTHEINRPFYERLWLTPRTLAPDRLSASARAPSFITVDDWHEFTDLRRVVEVHHVAGNGHDDGLLMVWLPRERILIQADAPAEGDDLDVYAANLEANIERLGLAVERRLALRGEVEEDE